MGSMPSFTAKSKKIGHRLRPTENSATNAWNLNLNDGNANNWNTKASNTNRVRAVSALFTENRNVTNIIRQDGNNR